MSSITETQFSTLYGIHTGELELRYAPKQVTKRLVALGYITEDGKVTGAGESLINDVHDDLVNGRLDRISVPVRIAIITDELFDENERRVLLHDDTISVLTTAITGLDVTMDDCVRYADEDATPASVRVTALTGIMDITQEQLALFTGFADEDTIEAVLRHVTIQRDVLVGVVTPTVIDHWIDGNADDSRELLLALVRADVPLTPAQFERLYVPDDVDVIRKVLGTPDKPMYQGLLTPAEREALVTNPDKDIRYEAAVRLNGLTVDQLRRLGGDFSDIVRTAIMTRLRPLAEALQLVDPSATLSAVDVNAIVGAGMLA